MDVAFAAAFASEPDCPADAPFATSSAEPEPAAAPYDPARLAPLCKRLAQLFEDDDPRAGKLFEEQAELLRSAFNEGYGPLESAVRSYDFEAALVVLREMAGQRDISL